MRMVLQTGSSMFRRTHSTSTRALSIRHLSGWSNTEKNREAKYYAVTKAGLKALEEETLRWRQMSGVVEKLLAEEQ